MAAARGVSRLGRKTLLALIDHIIQVLPGPNHDFVEPLVQDYVKALAEVLIRPSHVEFLARKGAVSWQSCVDFLLDIAEYSLPTDAHHNVMPPGRDSPIAASTPWSTGRSSVSDPSHKYPPEGGPLRDALEGLNHLVQAANAPVARRAQDIVDLVMRLLRIKNLSLGSTQTICFATANSVFVATQADDLAFAKSLVKDLLPLMGYWWRSDKVSQDDLIRAVRNEICATILLTHLHIEHLAVIAWDPDVRSDVEELIERLWLEYSRRSDAFRLQIHDLTFSTSALPDDYLKLELFGIRQYNVDGESHWALVQSLALLEAILLRPGKRQPGCRGDTAEPLYKKRRLREDSMRLRSKLQEKDAGVQRTALQVVPFLVAADALGPEQTMWLLVELASRVSDKNAATASWALIACARYRATAKSTSRMLICSSCAAVPGMHESQADVWRQLWHAAARSLSLPATSRASCLLLYTILEADLLPYHTLSEDVNSFVTMADVNGPAILCDSSLLLMSRLLHERNTRLPSVSQATSSHIIRWVFLKWNPSECSNLATKARLTREIR